MARYTVHVPKLASSRAEALERARFVRDGFSWGAFVFGALWLLWHRHWLVGGLALLASFALTATLQAHDLHPTALLGVHVMISLLYGLEGSSLRRLALGLAGWREVALVAGGNSDELEHRFFAAANVAEPAPLPTSGVPRVVAGGVLGLFPDARRP